MNMLAEHKIPLCAASRLRPVWLGALAAVALLAVTGCSSSSTTPSQGTGPSTPAGFREDQLPKELVSDLPLIAPKNDLEIPLFSGIVDVDPGADVTFCVHRPRPRRGDHLRGESFGSQSPRAITESSCTPTTPQEPHTGDCGSAMDGQMLLGGTGGKAVSDKATLPTNFGVEVPAGAQIVINHHWINTSAETVPGQTEMLARQLERGGDTVLAGNVPMVAFGWENSSRVLVRVHERV